MAQASSDVLPESQQLEMLRSLCGRLKYFEGVLIGHSEAASNLLRFLVEQGYINRALVEKVVHDQLLSLGVAMYLYHRRIGAFPDHLGSDEVFGYVMVHGRVHPEEVQFDHGETAQDYIKKADGLLGKTVTLLLSYKDSKPYVSDGEEVFCCC